MQEDGSIAPMSAPARGARDTGIRKALALTFALALPGCHAAVAPAGSGAGPRTRAPADLLAAVDFVQFRWESDSAPVDERYVDPASGRPVALGDLVVLDMARIDSAWVWRRPRDTTDKWDVVVRLSRDGAAAFGAATATNAGKRLGVVVDGRVTTLPLVTGALGSRAQIASGVRRVAADSLAARVNRAVAVLRPFQPVVLHRQ